MKEIQGPSETLSEYYALGEFVEYMRAQRKYSEHTCKAYSKDITQFYEFLSLQYGGEKAADPGLVTRIDMRLFLGFLLKKGLQPKSIARKLASVKSFYNYLLETGRIKVSVPAQVVTPRFSKTVTKNRRKLFLTAFLPLHSIFPDRAKITGMKTSSRIRVTGLFLSCSMGVDCVYRRSFFLNANRSISSRVS